MGSFRKDLGRRFPNVAIRNIVSNTQLKRFGAYMMLQGHRMKSPQLKMWMKVYPGAFDYG